MGICKGNNTNRHFQNRATLINNDRNYSMCNATSFITLSLVTKIKGIEIVPKSSGLNWGQRPGRNPDQAYLAVPAEIQRSGFFPEIGEPFLLECDDGEIFKCVRSQANGKAIETPGNNAILGLYFRKRLGVRSGYTVTIQHLFNYGRTSVDIHYRNDYKYLLDFSVLSKPLNT